MTTRLVVFDCDGTLIDSQHMIVAAMNHAFEAHGLEVMPRDKVLSIVGLSLDEALAELLPEADPLLRKAVTEGYKDAFHHLRARSDLAEPLFPGAREAIERLAARDDILLGIATGKSQKGLRLALEQHDLVHFFITLQTADDAPSKPHPMMMERAMTEAGTDPRNTVLVGDTSYDIHMARAAGTHAFGVDWGYHDTELLAQAGASVILSDFAELHPALDTIWTIPLSKETVK